MVALIQNGLSGKSINMESQEGKLKVFISYSSLDRSSAFNIMTLLEQHGCDVWLDFFDIKPGEILEHELTANVEKANVVCLLLSPTSVASKWVTLETQIALKQRERGLRILPIILRPCKIPELLGELLAIDVSREFTDQAVNLQIVRAVFGEEVVAYAEMLTAGKRAEFAKRELQDNADQQLPNIARELDRIRQKPIREISLSIDTKSFPTNQPTILELRLILDPLWTQPMSFYVAPYCEGATWPEGFDFPEPLYTDYFKARRPRVDCKFQWFDRTVALIPTLDSFDFDVHELPATFTLRFDGEEFQPGGHALHIPQQFEIPPLQTLCDKESYFVLIAHYPQMKSAEYVDLQLTDINLVLTARFADSEPTTCRLFRSFVRKNEQIILRCKYLLGLKSVIEREALLSLYPIPKVDSDPGRKRRLIEAIAADQTIQEQDRRLAARLGFGEALLASIQGDDFKALNMFYKVALLMQPIVLEGYPTYEEGILMYKACENLVGYYLAHKKFARAADFINSVGLVAQRLVNLNPNEPDYWRLWADALLKTGIVHAENGNMTMATDELSGSVETWRKLYKLLPSRERLSDAQKVFATVIDLAKRWGIESQMPLDVWRSELDANNEIEADIIEKNRIAAKGPAWLERADPQEWPTVPFESPLLRYSLRIPKHWSTTPKLNPLSLEVEHIFRGSWPTEWLIVSFMDKASTGGRMTDWVDGLLAVTGFPILAMTSSSGPQPKLLQWYHEGSFDLITKKLDVDETHCFSGVAQLPTEPLHLARIYILLARRGTFAWKVTLSIETAYLPSMPAHLITSNDHVRAGAVLGDLRFG